LAWLATYVEAIKEMAAYANRMQEDGRFGETEQPLTRIGLGDYLDQTFSAIPMNQGEFVRPADFGLAADQIELRTSRDIEVPPQSPGWAWRPIFVGHGHAG
jgi:(2S)-methylsuccinyl-CoA dehydrogenase